jgi:tRNA pseudouridine38-40 synthase
VRTFRLRVGYDGTDFHGWQRQPGTRTAQGELERALSDALEESVITVGAGRTDAGVHARGQVATFRSGTPLPAKAVRALGARRLPADLELHEVAEAEDGFDARRSARWRRYRYRLIEQDDVLWRRFAWWPERPLRLEGLARAVEPLAGEHDFSAFRASGGSPGTPVCRVLHAGWTRWEGGWALDLTADHFLYHMVRNVVGTAIALMRSEDPAGEVTRILAGRDRGAAGATAPPHGLCLEEVGYAG